jgi:hypothetical protein
VGTFDSRGDDRRAAVLALGLALASCGSPQSRAAQALEKAGSWAATVELAGASWSANAVPTAFTRNTLRTAQRALERERRTLESAAEELPAGALDQGRQTVDAVSTLMTTVSSAFERGDRAGVARDAQRLHAPAASLRALAAALQK